MTNHRIVVSRPAPRWLSAALATALAVPVVIASAGDAEAGRITVRARASASARATVRVGTPRVRVRAPRVRMRPGRVRVRVRRPRPVRVVRPRIVYPRYRPVYVGGYYGYYGYSFASPPPPYCDAPVTVYDRAAPAGPVGIAPVPERPLPRFALGVTGSHIATEQEQGGGDLGVAARLRILDPLEVEIEAAKTEFDDGSRIDKRFGAALYLDLAPRARWAPYAVAGGGVARAETLGDERERQYGEVGGGLRWNLTDRFALTGDLRFGMSEATDGDELRTRALVVQPLAEEERYSRLRLSGLLYF